MRASHDTMIISLTIRSGSRLLARPVVVPSELDVQTLLTDVLDAGFDDLDVRINGRSRSRLTLLLPGDRVEVRGRAS